MKTYALSTMTAHPAVWMLSRLCCLMAKMRPDTPETMIWAIWMEGVRNTKN